MLSFEYEGRSVNIRKRPLNSCLTMASAVIISGGTPLFYEVIQYMATKRKTKTTNKGQRVLPLLPRRLFSYFLLFFFFFKDSRRMEAAQFFKF